MRDLIPALALLLVILAIVLLVIHLLDRSGVQW